MIDRRWRVALVAFVLAGCATAVPPPPASIRTVAVFPPLNETGEELLIAGGSILEKYVFHTERFTVTDVLAAEARSLLAQRGYDVVSPEAVEKAVGAQPPDSRYAAAMLAKERALGGAVMFIDLRRWVYSSPDAIIVSLRVDVVESGTGRVLWSVDRPSRPVSTQGTIDVANAYYVAARRVMSEALESFTPPAGAGVAPQLTADVRLDSRGRSARGATGGLSRWVRSGWARRTAPIPPDRCYSVGSGSGGRPRRGGRWPVRLVRGGRFSLAASSPSLRSAMTTAVLEHPSSSATRSMPSLTLSGTFTFINLLGTFLRSKSESRRSARMIRRPFSHPLASTAAYTQCATGLSAPLQRRGVDDVPFIATVARVATVRTRRALRVGTALERAAA